MIGNFLNGWVTIKNLIGHCHKWHLFKPILSPILKRTRNLPCGLLILVINWIRSVIVFFYIKTAKGTESVRYNWEIWELSRFFFSFRPVFGNSGKHRNLLRCTQVELILASYISNVIVQLIFWLIHSGLCFVRYIFSSVIRSFFKAC